MNKYREFVSVVCIVLVLSLDVYSENISDIHFKNYVVDTANLLSEEEYSSLCQKLKKLEEETTNQFFVAIIKSLDGQKLEDFALELYNRNGIGHHIKNNGILLFIPIQDRKIRISVGYGLENIITDSFASLVIKEDIVPQFKNGEFYNGINNAVSSIKNELLKPDIKQFFTMSWDITNFENFISKYPESIQRCDALMFLGRFYEDLWNASIVKFLQEDKREKSIEYYQKYLSACSDGIWKKKVEYELSLVKNKKPDSQRYLSN